MNIKDINKGLCAYHNRIGLVVVDGILPDGRISCDNGHIIVFARDLSNVDMDFLASRRVTQADLDARGAHI